MRSRRFAHIISNKAKYIPEGLRSGECTEKKGKAEKPRLLLFLEKKVI